MKKKLFSVLCVILTLSLVLSLTACGGGDKQKLIGTWKCEKDLASVINDEFAADEEVASILNIDEFKLVVYLEFHEDNTFAMWVDADSVDDAMDKMIADVTDDIIAYMEDQMKEQTGQDLSIDDILSLAGLTMDELLEQMFPEEALEELKNEVVSSMSQEGKFKAENGKLYSSAGLEYNVDPLQYETYTLEGSTLTILGFTGDEDAADQRVYPMTFIKEG